MSKTQSLMLCYKEAIMKKCCSENVDFGDRNVAFCSVCGECHTRISFNLTQEEAAKKIENEFNKKYTSAMFYAKKRSISQLGEDRLGIRAYSLKAATGTIDRGLVVEFSLHTSTMVFYRVAPHVEADYTALMFTFHPSKATSAFSVSIELSEEEVYTNPAEELTRIVKAKAIPCDYTEMSPVEFLGVESAASEVSAKLGELMNSIKHATQ